MVISTMHSPIRAKKNNMIIQLHNEKEYSQCVVGDLPVVQNIRDDKTLFSEVIRDFQLHPEFPAVVLTHLDRITGMISRERCFELLGRPYGIEIYSRKRAADVLSQVGSEVIILDHSTTVQNAVKTALSRRQRELYDPLIIRQDNNYYILSMDILLSAQCVLLEEVLRYVDRQAKVDPLTNISNRRGLFEAAQKQLINPDSDCYNLAVLMIDIDKFKRVNDQYGHMVGDCVIQAVAIECQNALRKTDLLGRFGGEEFVALLPDTTLVDATAIAERVRGMVENLVITVDHLQVEVTVSIGVCHMQDAQQSLDILLNRADKAMYVAKAEGRNKVRFWNTQMEESIQQGILTSFASTIEQSLSSSRSSERISLILDDTIEGWARALELRDKETEGHGQRVTAMAIELARRVGVPEEAMADIRRGALLHDIGKIAIPDHILFKPDKLTPQEWEIMRKHPSYAYELLAPIASLAEALVIPYCHHEHWDGSGYPRGLKGEEIPLAARIFTIIDVYDALSTDRCYRPAWKREDVYQYLLDETGRLFDPAITPLFFDLLKQSQLVVPVAA